MRSLVASTAAAVILAACLALASCSERRASVSEPAPLPSPPESFLTLKNGSEHALGKDDVAWCFEVEGRGARRARVELLVVRDGAARSACEHTFDLTPEPFRGKIVVLEQHGAAFGVEGRAAFSLDASLSPRASSSVVRRSSALLEGVRSGGQMWIGPDSASPIEPGERTIILERGFQPAASERQGFRAVRSVEEAEQTAKDQGLTLILVVLSWEKL